MTTTKNTVTAQTASGSGVGSRQYKSGSKWALWRWTYTPSGYITRLHLLKTPWFAVCLHWLNGPDPEPDLHDHPVTFLSLVLRGGYRELRRRGTHTFTNYVYRHNVIRATALDCHRIEEVCPGTVTLCFMGPKRREWGFHTPEGWVYWKDYNRKYDLPRTGNQ
jgi:hypothetical protein